MERDELIVALAKLSKTDEHEVITECLEFYHKQGTKDLTKEQLSMFLKRKIKELGQKNENNKESEELEI